MTEFMKTYKLKITTFSPVHIGASSELEPTEYVICKPDQADSGSNVVVCPECGYKNSPNEPYCLGCDAELPHLSNELKSADSYLYTFTSKQLLKAVDRNGLMASVKCNSMLALQRFFKDNAAKIAKAGTKRAVVSPDVAQKYYNKFGTDKNKDNDFCKFFIKRQISDAATGLPYIPGSSLKGAIRTAVIAREFTKLDTFAIKKSSELEKALFKGYTDATNDPFKAVKLCDSVAASPFMTSIDQAENVKRYTYKVLDNEKGISTSIEVIPDGNVFESSLSVILNVHKDFTEKTMPTIRQSCNDFYLKILAEQEKYQTNIYGVDEKFFNEIRVSCQKPKTFLLCLGMHGGVESKTIEGFRNIKIMRGKGKSPEYRNHGTTFWFANDGKKRLPFGWCVVEYEEVK